MAVYDMKKKKKEREQSSAPVETGHDYRAKEKPPKGASAPDGVSGCF